MGSFYCALIPLVHRILYGLRCYLPLSPPVPFFPLSSWFPSCQRKGTALHPFKMLEATCLHAVRAGNRLSSDQHFCNQATFKMCGLHGCLEDSGSWSLHIWQLPSWRNTDLNVLVYISCSPLPLAFLAVVDGSWNLKILDGTRLSFVDVIKMGACFVNIELFPHPAKSVWPFLKTFS